MYSDDQGVEKKCYIEMQLSGPSRGTEQQAEVTLNFGDTEIKVSAKGKAFSRGGTEWGETKNLVIINRCDAWYSTMIQSKDQLWDTVRDAPLNILGGLEFLLFANFFFYLREKTIFFFGDQRPTIFFMFHRRMVNVVDWSLRQNYIAIW